MVETKTWIRISFGLGIGSALAGFISNLALMDIQYGGSGLRLEWHILHISYAVFILFHLSTLVTLARILTAKAEGKR